MSSKEFYFVHQQGSSLLSPVSSYLQQLGIRKSTGIDPNSLEMHYNDGLEICYVLKGIYKWQMEDKEYQVYPGDIFITCPWQWHGSPREVLDRGILSWIVLIPEHFTREGNLILGEWSRLDRENQNLIGRLLANNKSPVISKGGNLAEIYRSMYGELTSRELCYRERVNLLLDNLLINISRSLVNREEKEDKDESFESQLQKKMEDCILQKISMEDMAFSFGMGISSFNKKVKNLTGFSPMDYLLGIKINRAKQLLLNGKGKIKMLDIALECGFCSSQHFAFQFAKRVGVSPSRFREENDLS